MLTNEQHELDVNDARARVGTRLGKYVVTGVLGVGGMSSVLAGRHADTGHEVALKVLHARLARLAGMRTRFLQEALSWSKVKHPGVVKVHDIENPLDGLPPYVVMERLYGASLSDWSVGRSREEVLARIVEMLDVLAAAHDAGVVHRDVKPDNVFVETTPGDETLTARGVRLLDFGIARAPESNAGLTKTSTRLNTLAYVAPEQARDGKSVTAASDVWSVGVMLYETLTATSPLPGETTGQVLDQLLSPTPLPSLRARRDLPEALAALVDVCLSKDPSRRPSARAVCDRLAERPGHSLETAPAPNQALDENVQFTVYRPAVMKPERWYKLLVYAHLSEKPPDAAPDDPDPLIEVERRAKESLGSEVNQYKTVRGDATAAIPREEELTFAVHLPGLDVKPATRSFLWLDPVHAEEMRVRAPSHLDGQVVRGSLTVYLGIIVVAELSLTIRIDGRTSDSRTRDQIRPYRRIFASYSHRDAAIVEQFERYAASIGDRYLRDVIDLRSGEEWNDRLMQMIQEADVFQLFWSSNSMRSRFVQREWEHAMSLGRAPGFVRPVYWEHPFPEDAAAGLPPERLRSLHFQRFGSDRTTAEHGPSGDHASSPASSRPSAERTALPILAPLIAVALAIFFPSWLIMRGSDPDPTGNPPAWSHALDASAVRDGGESSLEDGRVDATLSFSENDDARWWRYYIETTTTVVGQPKPDIFLPKFIVPSSPCRTHRARLCSSDVQIDDVSLVGPEADSNGRRRARAVRHFVRVGRFCVGFWVRSIESGELRVMVHGYQESAEDTVDWDLELECELSGSDDYFIE